MKKKDDFFTERAEFHYKPSEILSTEETQIALKSILKLYGVEVDTLVPIVEINNVRHGINISKGRSPKNSEKIGFVVIDEYHAKTLNPDGTSRKELPKTLQIEAELLPEHVETYQENKSQLKFLFEYMERRLEAELAPDPKYIQALKAGGEL